ncbi:MAG TPA: spermidine/putrescine ABC transporter substrate-binding protein [Clostridiales bacterium]|nr:spermidine/putrescine ABC transporter substrate-binding protein [Clostridiales bacterium]
MKRLVSLVLVLALTAAVLLSGCAKKQEQKVVNVYNWGENIDESIFKIFEKQTGIKVNYTTYESNEQLYAVLKMGGTNYDVIIPSDYMISRLIEEGMLEKLDFNNIPNFDNIDERYKNLEYDPANEYSVPYTWGVVGLIYNTSMIDDEITSWGALFDPKYSGQILQFDNSRDAMATALFHLGYSVNTTDEAELNEAYELLVQQKTILQGYVMDQIYDKLEGGEAAIGPYYAGDALLMMENNPDLAFVVPEEGTNLFVDAMCIPKGAVNKENAELFINFMCDTDIALKNMAVTCYATPVRTAYEALDEETRSNEIMFPKDDVLNRCQIYKNLPQETLNLYDQLWVKLKS